MTDPLHGNPIGITEDQAHALLAICNASVELVTSKKMLNEVLESSELAQRAILTLVATLAAKLPFQEIQFTYGGSGLGSGHLGAMRLGGGGYVVQDALLGQLQTIFESADAEHIYQATKGGCSYFLTLDASTILNRVKSRNADLGILCPGLSIVSPQELNELLQKDLNRG